MAAARGTTATKKASAVKKSKAPLHPPYIEMIKEALLALKERTGSSHYAIAKHIEEQQKVTLPPNFKKILSVQLKRFVASGNLVKIKNSFKLPPPTKKSPAADEAAKLKLKPKPKFKEGAAAKKAAVKAKPKGTPVKKAKAVAKPKAASKPKDSKEKVTKKTLAAKSPVRKLVGTKVKKAAEKSKKPKSIKSPAKKAKK